MLLAFCEKKREREKNKENGLEKIFPLKHVPSILYHEYRFLGQILMK